MTGETTHDCAGCEFLARELKDAREEVKATREEAKRLALSNRQYAKQAERLVDQNLELCNTLEYWEKRRTGKAS